jgi:hypothetical protein
MLLRAVGTWTPSRELLVQQFYSYAILTRTPFLLVRHSYSYAIRSAPVFLWAFSTRRGAAQPVEASP